MSKVYANALLRSSIGSVASAAMDPKRLYQTNDYAAREQNVL
jgi:hypothetical protein